MQNNILLSPIPLNEFSRMVEDCVCNAMAKQKQPELDDQCGIDGASKLTGRSRSFIYKETSLKRGMPFMKFGSRLIFSRKALTLWMQSQTHPVTDPSDEVSDQLSAAATRKAQ
jgi:hypothetical protein